MKVNASLTLIDLSDNNLVSHCRRESNFVEVGINETKSDNPFFVSSNNPTMSRRPTMVQLAWAQGVKVAPSKKKKDTENKKSTTTSNQQKSVQNPSIHRGHMPNDVEPTRESGDITAKVPHQILIVTIFFVMFVKFALIQKKFPFYIEFFISVSFIVALAIACIGVLYNYTNQTEHDRKSNVQLISIFGIILVAIVMIIVAYKKSKKSDLLSQSNLKQLHKQLVARNQRSNAKQMAAANEFRTVELAQSDLQSHLLGIAQQLKEIGKQDKATMEAASSDTSTQITKGFEDALSQVKTTSKSGPKT